MVCLISLHFQVKLVKSLALEGMLGGGITSRGDGAGVGVRLGADSQKQRQSPRGPSGACELSASRAEGTAT